MATAETVKGNFSGSASGSRSGYGGEISAAKDLGGSQAGIEYLGGRATFHRAEGRWRMRLVRDGQERIYEVARTIGSRFFQYYVGRLISGPEPQDHWAWNIDHVLPFGFWLDQQQWVPVVHLGKERADGERDDPFLEPAPYLYDKACAACHTTRPLGDWMLALGAVARMEIYSPQPISFFASAYLSESHPNTLPADLMPSRPSKEDIKYFLRAFESLPAPRYAATLGVSCEACHNGCRQHIDQSTRQDTSQFPLFFPSSPHVFIRAEDPQRVWGRNPENLNWICARCHSGPRPHFAAGMSTWNSTEFTDAAKGHCYGDDPQPGRSLPRLTCIHCHDPHRSIGPRWTASPAADDAKCIHCHQVYRSALERLAHTHHPEGSTGSRCMNCHMPKINEGMQDVVRTHTIFSPTEPQMIEANQPNACNLCHLDEPLDWTLKYFKDWYGEDIAYDKAELAENYPAREGPVGLGWLQSEHESTRLAAVEALAEANAEWALPEMIRMLDDPFLLNRQFTQNNLQKMLGIRLEEFGYQFYMTKAERREPIARLRAAILGRNAG